MTPYGGLYDQQGVGVGLMFKLIPAERHYEYRALYDFNSFDDLHPSTTPTLSNDGVLYGTSEGGIPIMGQSGGAVWELQLGGDRQ